jgi:Heparinase II/III-like protein/Heparinase II/III N-terminus
VYLGFSIVSNDKTLRRLLPMLMRAENLRQGYRSDEKVALRRASRAIADALIYTFDRAEMDDPAFGDRNAAAIDAERASIKIFIQLAAWDVHGPVQVEINRKNQMIETMARRCGAHLMKTTELMRSGAGQRMKKSGRPNLYGYLSMAHSIVRLIRLQIVRAGAQKAQTQRGETLPDIQAIKNALSWDEPFLPTLLKDSYGPEAVVDLMAGIISFPSWEAWGKFPLGEPIDWSMEGANLSWQSYFTGLTFLQPVLAYWFDWANGIADSDRTTEALRARDIDPNSVLSRCGAIIADFVRRNPAANPANRRAFSEGTISHRVKTLLMFMVCSHKAETMGATVDDEALGLAFRSLTEALQILRSPEIYPEAGNHGVRQDSFFIATGLLLHKLPYGQEQLRLGLDRLLNLQVKPALSSDGVWLENSFGYHCLIMNLFTKMAADLAVAGEPGAEVLRDALHRMWPFAEAMIKPDGTGPLIGDTSPRKLFPIMARARAVLDSVPENTVSLRNFTRAKSTYAFPQAGYFVSHTGREMPPHSSTMIFFANLIHAKHKHSDDLSVLFSIGETDLLVDGGTYNKEISDRVRNAARHDPASHNTFRLNGTGYKLRSLMGKKNAGLEGSWEGDGWAAARGFNRAYADGQVSRVAIHLKEHHAVIVFDRLSGKGNVLFEQFWHIAPEFQPRELGLCEGQQVFSSEDAGHLLVAFDSGPAECVIARGGKKDPVAWLMLPNGKTVPTPYIRRSLTTRAAAIASLFQWSPRRAEIDIAFTEMRNGAVEINAHGDDFVAKFAISETAVECLALQSISIASS